MKHNLKIGILLTIMGGLTYAVLAAVVRHSHQFVPMPVMVFFQSSVALLLSLPLILRQDIPNMRRVLRTAFPGTHLVRTAASLGISYLLFYAVNKIPLVNAVLLANTAPLFVPFLGFLFLRQTINHRLWPSLIIGFLGVALILHPDLRQFNIASLYALGAGACVATSMLLVRRAASKDAGITSAFYYFLFSTVISGVVAIIFWVPISMSVLLLLLAQGVLFFVTQYSVTSALSFADAQIVSALFYSNVIFAALISLLVFHTAFSFLMIAGIILTVMGGVLTILVQHRCRMAQVAKNITV